MIAATTVTGLPAVIIILMIIGFIVVGVITSARKAKRGVDHVSGRRNQGQDDR